MFQPCTPADVTRSMIRDWRDEAGVAGDIEMVKICDRALKGDEGAIAEVARCETDSRIQRG